MSWQSVELANVATVFNGKTPSKAEQRDSGHPVLKIRDVDDSGVFKGNFGSFVDPEFAEKFSSKKINVDDTLVLNAAHNSDYVGSKQYRAEGSVVGSLPTGEWLIARADEEQLNPRFLNYWFRSPQARFQIKYLVKGIHLYPKDVARLEIPLPPLAEQKRIATILDKADAIRRKRQQAIQLADEFLRAVFLDMFGDPNSNSNNVKVLPMTEIFEIKTGRLNSNAAVGGGRYPFFTCAKEVSSIDEYAFDQEALLLAGNNAQADYDVKHYSGKFNAYQRTYVLSLKNSELSYPFYKFALEYQLTNLKRVSKGSNTKYITMEIMSRTMLPVPIPSEQRSFVNYFEKVRSLRSSADAQSMNIGGLFRSLSHEAFAGNL